MNQLISKYAWFCTLTLALVYYIFVISLESILCVIENTLNISSGFGDYSIFEIEQAKGFNIIFSSWNPIHYILNLSNPDVSD